IVGARYGFPRGLQLTIWCNATIAGLFLNSKSGKICGSIYLTAVHRINPSCNACHSGRQQMRRKKNNIMSREQVGRSGSRVSPLFYKKILAVFLFFNNACEKSFGRENELNQDAPGLDFRAGKFFIAKPSL